jgi:hypothetical protein
MRGILTTITVLALPGAVAAQSTLGADAEAVRQTVLDYATGARSANGDLIARTVHPELTNVMLASYRQTGKQFLRHAGASYVVEAVRGGMPAGESEEPPEIIVYDVADDMAAAKLTSPRAASYLQLVRIHGTWKIINALRVARSGGSAGSMSAAEREDAEAAITRAALDYIDGSYSGDAERMTRALHPELTKVLLTRHPRTDQQFLVPIGATDLIEGTRARLGLLEESARHIDVTVYDLGYGTACAKVVSASYVDHIQLANIDGGWKIVNVLWVPNPSAPTG